MRKFKVTVVEYSPVCDDGSRKTMSKEVIASCNRRGDAENIAWLLRNYTYDWMYDEIHNTENTSCFRIAVEQ